jgi:ABC-2 type transport system ATP-binding protein
VAAAAAAALAARRVVVDRHEVADRDALDARADLDHLAGRLVAEHGGQLAADVERLHVGAAGRAGQHAAHDLAGAGDRVRRRFQHRFVLGERAGDPHLCRARRGHPARWYAVRPALSVSGLEKAYGSVRALIGVDLEVGEGELVGLLGPNGAGKSTLVKIACGLVTPTAGAVAVCGAPAGSIAANRELGYLAELFRFPDWCTGEELLALHQKLAESEGGAAERWELLELVGLADAGGRRIGTMSKGMQQRLGLAQALIGGPRMLLLDEPTSALDPAGRRTVRALLEELRSRGVSVLLNSHLLSEVELVCDRVAIIARGALVAAGTPAELAHAGGVEVETANGARLFPDARRDDAPRIVRELVAAGEEVYGVRVLTSTLEDAYLEAVEGR